MVGLGELGSVLDRVGLQVRRVLEDRLEPLRIFLEEHRFATRVQRGAPCWLGEALSYPLLLSSVTGMMVSLAALASGLMVIDHSDRKITWALDLCIIMLLAFVASFSIGMGPITWVQL